MIFFVYLYRIITMLRCIKAGRPFRSTAPVGLDRINHNQEDSYEQELRCINR